MMDHAPERVQGKNIFEEENVSIDEDEEQTDKEQDEEKEEEKIDDNPGSEKDGKEEAGNGLNINKENEAIAEEEGKADEEEINSATNLHKSKSAVESEEDICVELTLVVTHEKVKKPMNPNKPSPTKVAHSKPKSPSKKAASKPLKVTATATMKATSEALKTSRKEPM
ncbi:uncharacterized protein LOC127115487 [Lathyrus oleraceus]|uniref:uncharacterized protein LOC127115487 n=1 Tax=Pisum sativum TaxID=3888 RepID=UPI0021CF00AC|nr:uncharacterized protein LOC127115487 [Pisum sativum]